MKSSIIKRSIVLAGHKTSVSLEDAFWESLKEIALVRKETLASLVTSIDARKAQANLSSAIRLFILGHYQTRPNDHVNGHDRANRTQPEVILS